MSSFDEIPVLDPMTSMMIAGSEPESGRLESVTINMASHSLLKSGTTFHDVAIETFS